MDGAHHPPRLQRLGLFLLAALLLLAGIALTFGILFVVSPDQLRGRYDVYRYYGPVTYYLDFCLRHVEFPLWNPLVYCGIPHAGNPQAFLYYPPNLLRSLLLPAVTPYNTQASIALLVGLHLLVLGLSTYLLGRAHKLSFPGALAAGATVVFSALMVRRAAEYHFLYTIAWTPLILLFLKHMLDAQHWRDKIRYSAVAALLVGLSILGGFVQVVVYLGVTCAFYALAYRVLHLPHRGKEIFRLLVADACCFGAVFAFAGAVAAVMLLPTAELSAFSARHAGTKVPMYSDLMSWDIKRWYQSLVIFTGTRYEAETARGAGVIAWMLAATALFHPRRKNIMVFLLLLYVLVDCSFGPPFPVALLVNLVTPFSSSAYSRGFDLAMIPLGLLVGHGVDLLAQRRPSLRVNAARSLVLVYVAGATLIPLGLWAFPHPFLPTTNLVLSIPIAAFGLMLVLPWLGRPRRLRLAAALGVTLLLFAETYVWNYNYVPWMITGRTGDARDYNASVPQFPKDNTRGVDPIPNRFLYAMEPVFNGVDPLHLAAMRDFLSGRPRDTKPFRAVTDWEPTAENQRGNLYLKRFLWLAREYVVAPVPDKQTPFPSATTVFLAAPPPLELPERPAAQVPRSSMSAQATQVPVPVRDMAGQTISGRERSFRFSVQLPGGLPGKQAGSAGAVHSALLMRYGSHGNVQVDTTFVDPRTGRMRWGMRYRLAGTRTEQTLDVPLPDWPEVQVTVLVKPGGSANLTFGSVDLATDAADEDGLIHIEQFTPGRMEATVGPLEGPRILSYLDANYPGWHVEVDGKESPLLKADDLFKAVALPAGTHRVAFVFRPTSFYVGLIVSLSTVAGLILVLGVISFLGRRKGATAGATPATPAVREAEESAVETGYV